MGSRFRGGPPGSVTVRRIHLRRIPQMVPRCHTLAVLPRPGGPRAPPRRDYRHVCDSATNNFSRSRKCSTTFHLEPIVKCVLMVHLLHLFKIHFADGYMQLCERGVDCVRRMSRGQPASCREDRVGQWPTSTRTALHSGSTSCFLQGHGGRGSPTAQAQYSSHRPRWYVRRSSFSWRVCWDLYADRICWYVKSFCVSIIYNYSDNRILCLTQFA